MTGTVGTFTGQKWPAEIEIKRRQAIGLTKLGNQNRLGKLHRDDSKLKMSIGHKGLPSPRRGVVLSDEIKAKISVNRKGKGLGHHRKHTEATKDKIRAARAKQILSVTSKSATQLLNELEQYLGIKIEREYPIRDEYWGTKIYDGRWKRMLIEVDGSYWHSRPWSKQADHQKDVVAREHGYRIHRIQYN